MRRLPALLVACSLSLLGACGARDSTLGSAADPPSQTGPRVTRSTDATDRAPGWEQRQGERALAMLRFDWRVIGYRVAFLPARDAHVALTYPTRRSIHVFVRPGMSTLDVAHVVAHELGHAYDLRFNGHQQRRDWKVTRGIEGAPGWLDAAGGTDFGLPGGDYAEVFALWALRGKGMFRSQLAPRPGERQLERLGAQYFTRVLG